VNDSCYTNNLAVLTLQHAAEVLQALGQPVPANWSDIAERIAIPWFRRGSFFSPPFKNVPCFIKGTPSGSITPSLPDMI
jgi:hypothetical protein